MSWCVVEGPNGLYTEHIRAWRTNLETALGSDKICTVWLEKVRIYTLDGAVIQTNLGSITIAYSDLSGTDVILSDNVESNLTALIGSRVEALYATS